MCSNQCTDTHIHICTVLHVQTTNPNKRNLTQTSCASEAEREREREREGHKCTRIDEGSSLPVAIHGTVIYMCTALLYDRE